jgi:hypothetical protein
MCLVYQRKYTTALTLSFSEVGRYILSVTQPVILNKVCTEIGQEHSRSPINHAALKTSYTVPL